MKTLLTIIFAGTMLAALVVVLAWVIVEWGKKQMKWVAEYEKLYISIQRDIITHEPYDQVRERVAELQYLKWKNSEKTRVLKESFYREYREEDCKFLKKKLMDIIDKKQLVG